MANCVGDWMKLRCGDRVTERGGRHVARVEAIINSAVVRVRWLDTGWISEYHLGELVKASADFVYDQDAMFPFCNDARRTTD